jgi:hypothetical protein
VLTSTNTSLPLTKKLLFSVTLQLRSSCYVFRKKGSLELLYLLLSFMFPEGKGWKAEEKGDRVGREEWRGEGKARERGEDRARREGK